MNQASVYPKFGCLAVALISLGVLVQGPLCGSTASGIATVTGNAGLGDGSAATSARLWYPAGVVADGAGNIYVADKQNNRIRKFSVGGTISTYAGNGVPGGGGDGGAATVASLNQPWGVALDSSGNLYIADSGNNRIRKVSTAGIISTVAGTGAAGYSGDGGQATDAVLNGPYGIAVDGSGNLYIGDSSNYRVRKVTVSTGVISTIAGTGVSGYSGDGGNGTSAALGYPCGVSVDSSSNVYVADAVNGRIRMVNSGGIITTVAGTGTLGYSGDGGAATSAELKYPYAVVAGSSGTFYIADTNNLRIRMVSGGTITTIAGTGTSGYNGDNAATSTNLSYPEGVAVDVSGNVYIADTNSRLVRKRSTAAAVTTVAGNYYGYISGDDGLATAATLGGLDGIAMDVSGNLYIADYNYHRTRKITPAGVISNFAGTGVDGYSGDGGQATSATLMFVSGLATDLNGNVYIADANSNCVRKVNSAGVISTVAGTGVAGYSGDGGTATSATLNQPRGVAADSDGNLYIADSVNNVIRKVSAAGTITTIAGTGTAGYSGDGAAATAATLRYPWNLALDSAKNLYFVDSNNNVVRKISTSGIISTFAGSGSYGSSGDGGLAVVAKFAYPNGIAVDASGNVYISDSSNHRVRMVNTSGVISTVAGNGMIGTGLDGGAAPSSALYYPRSLAVDSSNHLYIAEPEAGRIRKVDLASLPEVSAVFHDTYSGISMLRPSTGVVTAGGGIFSTDLSVAQDGTGLSYVAARDTYNTLWINTADARTGAWGSWMAAGGVITGRPAIAVINGATPTAYIAIRDSWNSYWVRSYTTSGGFGDWQYLAGIFSTDPVMAACPDGSMYIVGKDTWNSLWSTHYTQSGGWSSWQWGQGIVQGKPSATCGRNSVLYVAVRDSWDSLWLAWVSGNQWLDWSYAAGIMNGDPQAASADNGLLHVALTDDWNVIWYRSYDTSTGVWKSWTQTGGILQDVAPASARGVLTLVGRDGSNNLWGYSGLTGQWTSFGQPTAAAGPLQASPR